MKKHQGVAVDCSTPAIMKKHRGVAVDGSTPAPHHENAPRSSSTPGHRQKIKEKAIECSTARLKSKKMIFFSKLILVFF